MFSRVQSKFCTPKSYASQSCQAKHKYRTIHPLLYFLSFFNLRQSASVALGTFFRRNTYARVRTYALLSVIIAMTLRLLEGLEQCATKFVQRFVNLCRKQTNSSEMQYTPVYFPKSRRSKRHDIQYREHLSNCYVGAWTNIDLSISNSTQRSSNVKAKQRNYPHVSSCACRG